MEQTIQKRKLPSEINGAGGEGMASAPRYMLPADTEAPRGRGQGGHILARAGLGLSSFPSPLLLAPPPLVSAHLASSRAAPSGNVPTTWRQGERTGPPVTQTASPR